MLLRLASISSAPTSKHMVFPAASHLWIFNQSGVLQFITQPRDHRTRYPASGHPRHPRSSRPQRQPTLSMAVRVPLPRHAARLLLQHTPSTQCQRWPRPPPTCLRLLSTSTHEHPPKPSIVPPSPLRSTPRPETLRPPPIPPRNDTPSASSITASTSPEKEVAPPAKKEPRFQFKPVRAALSLTPKAAAHIREILDQPEPKLVRVGVKNRGCAGLAYHLEYVDKPGKFDEVVEQDGTEPPHSLLLWFVGLLFVHVLTA